VKREVKREAKLKEDDTAEDRAKREAKLTAQRQAKADLTQAAYRQQFETFIKSGKPLQHMDQLPAKPTVVHIITLMYFLRQAPVPDQYRGKGTDIANDGVVHMYTGPQRVMHCR
jgi:hypothetical protein